MDKELKREALRQYIRFFRVWFVAAGLFAAVGIGLAVSRNVRPRGNEGAPAERVYDYADVLTDGEEEKLRNQIEKAQKRLRMDIVIVTFRESVEGADVLGSRVMKEYELPYTRWEDNMQALADDFWDRNGYGYNRSYEGDGILLLHNWYPGQNGEHLSTSGKAMKKLADIDRLDEILYQVDNYYAADPCRAYSEFIKEAERQLGRTPIPWFIVVVVPVLIAVVFASSCQSQNSEKYAVSPKAYITDGKPVINGQTDAFLHKHVSSRHIQRDSGGGSSRGGSSGGGSHRSSSGASHGGTSHRH